MRTGEIPDHWKELVENNSESSTNESIDLAHTWAEEEMESDGHSFQHVNFSSPSEGVPSASEGESPNTSSTNYPYTMPTLPDLDNITLRRSPRLKNKKTNYAYTIRNYSSYFAAFCLMGIVAFSTIFTSPSSFMIKSYAYLSVINQHFDGTLNYLHPCAFASSEINDSFTLSQML